MVHRVRETDEPRMEPPYPTYYPDTEYPTRFPDSQFFTYMPDTLWYRDKEEGEKEECHLVTSEIVVDFEGEAGEGGNCVVDMVEIVVNKGASALDDDALTAEMILDGKEPEMVQVTKARINIYRMDLFQAGIPESRRTLKGKREIMIRLRKKSTGYHYLTVGCDSRKRPYAHVVGRVLPLPQPQSRYYCLTDHNKNVTGLADDTGNVRASWDYDAFGNCISQSGDKSGWNPLRYSSEYYDQELGLIYYNYRHYNPRDGRWIGRDFIEESGGYNLYNYVKNNSCNYFDFVGNAVFVVTSDPTGDIFSIMLNSLNYYKDMLKKFKTEVENLNDGEYADAVEEKNVIFNGKIVDYSKDEYVKRIDHELSSTIENIVTGGWQAVESRIRYFSNKTKYEYDELYFMSHGNKKKETFIDPYVYSLRKIDSFFNDASSGAKGKKQVIACYYTFPGDVYTEIVFYKPFVTRKMVFFCVESVPCDSFKISVSSQPK